MTAWQIGVIATANYTFLNYLVLVLAVLLLDDQFLRRFVPERWRPRRITEDTEKEREHGGVDATSAAEAPLFSQALFGTGEPEPLNKKDSTDWDRPRLRQRWLLRGSPSRPLR